MKAVTKKVRALFSIFLVLGQNSSVGPGMCVKVRKSTNAKQPKKMHAPVESQW